MHSVQIQLEEWHRRVEQTRGADCTPSKISPGFFDLRATLKSPDEAVDPRAFSFLDKLGQISDNRRQVDGMATRMNPQNLIFAGVFGASRRIRTDDLLITNS